MNEALQMQHAEMREMLETLGSYKNLTFRAEKVPSLLSEFLLRVYQHFKSERQALSSIIESAVDKAEYDRHYISVLEDISEIQFNLMWNQDLSVSDVLPRMTGRVTRHEGLHSHLRLPLR